MTTYLVTYERVGGKGGRDGSPAPAPLTVTTDQPHLLEEQIVRDVRPHLGSSFLDAIVDLEAMRGSVFAGFRTAATFSLAIVEGGASE